MTDPSLRSPCGRQVVRYKRGAHVVTVTTKSILAPDWITLDVVTMSTAAAREDWAEAVGLGFTKSTDRRGTC